MSIKNSPPEVFIFVFALAIYRLLGLASDHDAVPI